MESPFSETLRWLLLGIGVLVVAAVYWLSYRDRGKPSVLQRVMPDFPRDGGDANKSEKGERLSADSPLADEPRVGHAATETATETVSETATETATETVSEPSGDAPAQENIALSFPFENSGDTAAVSDSELPGRLLILHVRCKSKHNFAGVDILRIAEREGLEKAVGSSGGFFQRNAPSPDSPPLFYIANMFSPGVFKWSEMDDFSTSGLSLFAQLPGALPPLKTFDVLLECARHFAEALQGSVCDESRSDLTAQTIQHIREDLQVYALGRALRK